MTPFLWRTFKGSSARLALATLFSLALGIAGVSAGLSLASGLLRAGGVLARRPLVGVMLEDPLRKVRTAPPPALIGELRDRLRCCEPVASYSVSRAMIRTEAGAREIQQALVGPRLFELLEAQPLAGRSLDGLPPAEAEAAALISLDLARALFGEPTKALGQSLTLDGRARMVVGLLPPRGLAILSPGARVDVVRPLDASAQRSVLTLTRLRAEVTLSQAQAELATWAAPEVGASSQGASRRWVLVPASDLLDSRLQRLIALAFGVGLLLLLVTAVNVAQFETARAAEERRGMAVRWALGAAPSQLLALAIRRAAWISLSAGLGATALAAVAMRSLGAVPLEELGWLRELGFEPWSLFAGTALGFVALVASSAFSAQFRAEEDLAQSLKPDLRLGGRPKPGRRLGDLHLVVLVAVAVVLGVAAQLMLVSIRNAARLDLGFEPDGLQVIELRIPAWKYREPAGRAEILERFREGMLGLPGASSMALAGQAPPEMGIMVGSLGLDGGAASVTPLSALAHARVGPGYFRVLGLPLLAGREFSDDDARLSSRVVVISAAVARYFGLTPEQALGRYLGSDSEAREVIGVAADVRGPGMMESLGELQVYWPLGPIGASITILGRGPEELWARAAGIGQSLDPDLMVRATSMRARLSRSLATARLLAALLSVLAGLAGALAVLGVYGALSVLAARQRRPLAVRKALGASPAVLWTWLLGESLGRTAIGVLLGVWLSYPFSRLLREQLFGLAPDHPSARLATAALVAVAAVLAALPVAWEVSRLDPGEVLRTS